MVERNQATEDYLEQILLLSRGREEVHRIDVAKSLGVSGAAVNKAVKILLERGFVYEDGKHLRLTTDGKRYAEEVFERHCIIRAFLEKLGVTELQAEQDACKLEHLVSKETLSAMKAFLEK